MIVTPNEFWEFLTKLRKDLFAAIPKVQHARVIGLTPEGNPIIQFAGEDSPSQKIYRYYDSYQPQIGDRVQLLNGVIQGGWKP